MTAARPRSGRSVTAAAVPAVAVLLYLAQAVPGQGWAAYIAFVPLMLAIHPGQRKRTVFLAGLGAGAAAFGGSLYWITTSMRDFTGLPFFVALLVLALLAVYLGTYLGLFALLIQQRPPTDVANTLFLAGAWTLLEYIRGTLFGGFPWHPTGLHLALVEPWKHLLSLTGPFGPTLLICLVNTATAGFIMNVRARRPAAAAACTALLLLPFAAAGAAALPPQAPDTTTGTAPVHVALIQPNIPQREKWDPKFRAANLAQLERLTRALPPAPSAAGPSLIVWPEATIPVFLQDHPEIEQRLARIAADRGTWLLAGMLRHEESGRRDEPFRFYNSAVLFGPDGRRRAGYDKRHLVPYGEFTPLVGIFPFLGKVVPGNDFSPGASPRTMRCGTSTFGPTVCFEGVFPLLVRQAVADGAAFLVNITNDAWFGTSSGPAQHLAHTRLRAMEHRQYLIRCANTGISAVVAPDGSLVESLPLGVAGTITALIHPTAARTFFARHPHVTPLIAALLLLPGFRPNRKRYPTS
ncbi:MAG: apolipoprotein N-acyltransferase [Deltaproteobacteria bacterium]|nr:apolipoprotein N-acyltransferase [Candidatus Anaeroferrophillacea bacterium]